MTPLFLLAAIMVEGGILDGIKGMFDVSDKDIKVKVDKLSWERSLEILELKEATEKGWCESMPKDAILQSVDWKIRSTPKVEQRWGGNQLYTFRDMQEWYAPEKRIADDGISYTWKQFQAFYTETGVAELNWIKAKVDNKTTSTEYLQQATSKWDGAKKKDCEGACCPNCFEEQVSDFSCEYRVLKWVPKDVHKSKDNTAFPYWPDVSINDCNQTAGCEKHGKKEKTYKVDLTIIEAGKAPEKTYCENPDHIDFTKWQLLEVGKSYDAKRRKVYGLLCGSINPEPYGTKKIAPDGKAYTYEEFVDWYKSGAPGKWQTAKWPQDIEL
jgi:hypothetical protein